MSVPRTRAGAPRPPRRAAIVSASFWLCLLSFLAGCQASSIPAFPGAEGYGANTTGGRGGRVIEVTNLDDIDPATGQAVPGSLRAAIEATGRRIVVFRVSGTIDVCEQNKKLAVASPYLTIAGQTAPGEGITLRLDPSCDGSALTIWQHDVVIRHLRIRPGSNPSVDKGGSDALTIAGPNAYNVVIDHCSFSWATDENVDVAAGARSVTIQYSIVSESLKGAWRSAGGDSGGYGMLVSEGDPNGNHTNQISVHHNLFAHNWYRNPQVSVNGLVDYRNNVVYDWGLHGVRILDVEGPTKMNIIGNLALPGPSTTGAALKREVWALHAYEYAPFTYFVMGNLGPRRPDGSHPELDLVWCREHDADGLLPGADCDAAAFAVATPWAATRITTTDPTTAYDDVLAGAGATLPARDAVDRRVIDQVANGTGGMIASPSQVGGWPALASGTAPPDSDHDGMPDAWETQYGLNPVDDADSPLDADRDGYTNVEEALNATNPTVDEGL